MKNFIGNCPKCNSTECEPTDYDFETTFVVVNMICNDCECEFDVIFDNANISHVEG